MNTNNVLNFSGAQAAKDEAIKRVGRNANPEWKALMLTLVIEVARELLFFTADDVYRKYYALDNPPVTHEQRAFGNVMQRAAKLGICKKSDRPAISSARKSLHASPIQVWESLILWN
jgi:hypothetical protein